jgi:hypothetical protein
MATNESFQGSPIDSGEDFLFGEFALARGAGHHFLHLENHARINPCLDPGSADDAEKSLALRIRAGLVFEFVVGVISLVVAAPACCMELAGEQGQAEEDNR